MEKMLTVQDLKFGMTIKVKFHDNVEIFVIDSVQEMSKSMTKWGDCYIHGINIDKNGKRKSGLIPGPLRAKNMEIVDIKWDGELGDFDWEPSKELIELHKFSNKKTNPM